ncbi:GNAT family N-acetyltransferase [Gottfriedia acidiceleris]|uniref:GNAT family N-acetyltransferase n=1 Tax=Gottfriedia acidiceleris TaxID=371036 RepID=A0ABY4JIQ4_9BACI|nr:GNAT family N-acetyltransferase [Gottfriedia acidiceleris]UPM53712.1 GNAT family N-acetyltransferase [Gottfriedia acidiceleris]
MSSNRLIIRESKPSEIDNIKKVLIDAYEQYASILSKEQWENYKNSIIDATDNSHTKTKLVATVDNVLLGACFIYDSAEKAYGLPELEINYPIIRLIGVSPKARGLGIATELIKASCNLSLEWGSDRIVLHTSDMMKSAISLYEKIGFQRAKQYEFMNGDILVKSYELNIKDTAILLN